MVKLIEDNHVIKYKNQIRQNVSINIENCISVAKSNYVWILTYKRKVKPAITFTFMSGETIQWAFNTTQEREKTYKKLIN